MKMLREAAVFLGAMIALALVVFAGFWLIIKAGGVILTGWVHLLGFLPRPLALALGVMLSALTVYALAYAIGRHRRKARFPA